MQPIISVHNLKKIYYMGLNVVNALQGVDLDIYKNEYVALMGPSGSGKSTLMNLIGCLDTPTFGEYILNGTNVSTMDDAELAEVRNKEIGFVFQTFNLLPRLSALENVALPLVYAGMGKKERLDKARHVLESVGLGDRTHHKPNELSGGQRQRVAVARALVNDPSIILADEPTGNLDSANGDDVMKILAGLNQDGTTIVMVTHSPYCAEFGNRIIRLLDGQVVTENIVQQYL